MGLNNIFPLNSVVNTSQVPESIFSQLFKHGLATIVGRISPSSGDYITYVWLSKTLSHCSAALVMLEQTWAVNREWRQSMKGLIRQSTLPYCRLVPQSSTEKCTSIEHWLNSCEQVIWLIFTQVLAHKVLFWSLRWLIFFKYLNSFWDLFKLIST